MLKSGKFEIIYQRENEDESVPDRQFQVREGKKWPSMSLREMCKVNAVFQLQGCRPRPKTGWDSGRRNMW